MHASTFLAMSAVSSLLPSALAAVTCSKAPLGAASSQISQLVEVNADAVITQLCDRPDDSLYNADASGVSLALDSKPATFTINLTSDDLVESPEACAQAFTDIVEGCFTLGAVWGGSVIGESGARFAIGKMLGADVDAFLAALEYAPTGIQSGIASSGLPASGLPVSGLPVSGILTSGLPVATGIVSGYPSLPSGY